MSLHVVPAYSMLHFDSASQRLQSGDEVKIGIDVKDHVQVPSRYGAVRVDDDLLGAWHAQSE